MRLLKWIVAWVAAMLLVISPYGHYIDISQEKVERVQAVGISLIGGGTSSAYVQNGELIVSIRGGATAGVSLGQDYYAQMQLPESLGYLLRQKNIRQNIQLDYRLPAPLLGVIPIRGNVKGDSLTIDLDNNLAMGSVYVPLNLSLISIFEFTFRIDLDALGVQISPGEYPVKINVGDTKLDLDLLNFKQSMAELVVQGDGGNASSLALVNILPRDLPPPIIVDPENPEQPYEPEEPSTGNRGALTLDHVTSFDFGTHAISSEAESYPSETTKIFVQITDRRGTGEGWRLIAQASAFRDETDQTLPRVELQLTGGSVVSTGNGQTPHVTESVRLTPGGSSFLVTNASPGSGLGTWTTRWLPSGEAELNDNVTLEVPGGVATSGTHTANITWTLIDAP